MEVISLHGTDDRLYELVSRLVMNPEILRQNNNYPFKTSNGHTWYLCMAFRIHACSYKRPGIIYRQLLYIRR